MGEERFVIAYVDTSVLLRVLLNQSKPLEQWDEVSLGVSSVLLRVEAQRTLDRLHLRREITVDDFALKQVEVGQLIDKLLLLPLDDSTIDFAARPLSPELRTLDSLHLATAIRYRRAHRDGPPILFATHDRALAVAARAHAFDVIGA